ncbi:MAG: RidA family protein [Sphingomonadales bacterium]|nr:RidA family protein [Sphingomonadales bacterium]
MTNAHRIKTTPDPFEPFKLAQGYRLGDLILLSGQAAITKEGEIVGADDFDAQAAQTFANIGELLELAGSGLDKVVKVTVYLTDMANFPKVIALREKYFTPPYPADTIVEVSALALPELMIEIDVMALANGEIVDAE